MKKGDLQPLVDLIAGPVEGPRRQMTEKMTTVSHFRDAKSRLRIGPLPLPPRSPLFDSISEIESHSRAFWPLALQCAVVLA